jgi:tetratricopeptide (TPR) repeat protein
MTQPDVSRATRSEPVIWGDNIPRRNKNFTGREEILTLLRGEDSSKVTAVVPGEPLPKALQGWGGVGKSAVAIEYAHRYRGDYQLVWWIPSDDLALVRSNLAALAEGLNLPSPTVTGMEAAAKAVLDALRRGEPYRRWLLIYDNADQPEDLSPYLPQGGPGDVLITSRNHRWQAIVDTVPLDVFTRAESVEFLTRRVRSLEEDWAKRLADKLGDLPLALEQAGALQAETGMTAEEYIALLDHHVSQMLAEGKALEYPTSMTAAWQMSVTALETKLPQARELLRCCAFFGPDPIPSDVFRRSDATALTKINELVENPILQSKAIRELGRFALVRIDGRTIMVHRLIQALLRDDLDSRQQESYRHEVHLILASSAPVDPDDPQQWPRYRDLLGHITSAAPDLASCQDPMVRGFVLNFLRYLSLSGDHVSCRALAQRFIEQWTADSGPDHLTVLAAKRTLGDTIRELGQYRDAYGLIEGTLRSARQTVGEKEPLTLYLRNSFGADLRARGEFANALQLDKNSVEIFAEVFGGTDPRTLRVMNNLALDYGLNSLYETAKDLHSRVFQLYQVQAKSESSFYTLNYWNGLARAVRLCGDYEEARDVGEEAYSFGRDQLGNEHFWTMRTALDLSIAYRRIGQEYDQAAELAEEVYRFWLKLVGEDHPDTMAAAITLTNVQRTTRQASAAVSLAETAVSHYPSVYGEDHPYNYGCQGNLALMRRVTGDVAEARRLNEVVLAGLDGRLGRDHHYPLTVATNLASDYAALGEVDAARDMGEDTLLRLRKLLGADHPLTLGCAANLSLDQFAMGDTEAAEKLSSDTMARYDRGLGKDHPDVMVARSRKRLDFDFDPPPI